MIFIDEVQTISAGASSARLVGIDLTPNLAKINANELLTGTPTIVELGTVNFDADGEMELDDDQCPAYTATSPAELTLTNKAVINRVTEMNRKPVAIQKGVVFLAAAPLDTKGNMYAISVSVGTTSNPAEGLVFGIKLRVI